ncbi:hypothetical protein A8F94_13935 [Bacillus sp. FJAT-27225]|uniref:hypothetical protein n=1 Tax=Bacillus sp. FJAT-27225 TaxID=1743144 RepID=UPI00080C3064|nr:hypothetical protein [Bacillus sp. FJAT-27225]OCA85943.1 hypothetical protein A8F94_13935 [Bacillus sp. FJAT-27225]
MAELKEKLERIISRGDEEGEIIDYSFTEDEFKLLFKISGILYEYHINREKVLDLGIYYDALDVFSQFEHEVKYLYRTMDRGIGSQTYIPFLKKVL